MGVIEMTSTKRIILLSMSLLALVLVTTSPAYASVFVYDYSGHTSAVQSPSVSLQTGTAGSTTISSVAADAATVSATAGITFYENANLPTSCSSPTVDSAVSAPGTYRFVHSQRPDGLPLDSSVHGQ